MNGDASWGPASESGGPRRAVCDQRGPYHEFARRVRVRHHLVEGTSRCRCGRAALDCLELRDAYELLGEPAPGAVQPQPMPARESLLPGGCHWYLDIAGTLPRPYLGEL